jgi:hypothetical protein
LEGHEAAAAFALADAPAWGERRNHNAPKLPSMPSSVTKSPWGEGSLGKYLLEGKIAFKAPRKVSSGCSQQAW